MSLTIKTIARDSSFQRTHRPRIEKMITELEKADLHKKIDGLKNKTIPIREETAQDDGSGGGW